MKTDPIKSKKYLGKFFFRGFTLIELLVVVSIIALLVSILLPALNRAREQAKRTKCATQLHEIGVGIASYAADNVDHIPESMQMMYIRSGVYNANQAISPYLTFWIYSLDDRNPPHIVTGAYNMAPLYDTGIIDQPEIFYCPGINANSSVLVNGSDPAQMFTWEAYKHQGETWPAPELPQRRTYGATRISYNYFPQSKNTRYTPTGTGIPSNFSCPKYTDKYSDLSAQYALVTDFLYTYEALPHQFKNEPTGINALFGDMHVAWSKEQEAFDHLTSEGNWSNAPGPFYLCVSLLRP
ncbi:MAG: type II secretion system protein [Sedimentisphaerales bacterium]|nr:type II secretion system protein [Sedimentisphaerales bacterium]